MKVGDLTVYRGVWRWVEAFWAAVSLLLDIAWLIVVVLAVIVSVSAVGVAFGFALRVLWEFSK